MTYKHWFAIDDPGYRVFLIVLGIVLFLAYFLLPKDSAKKLSTRTINSLGIKIEYPKSNAKITGGRTDVQGCIAKAIPDGYELRVLRGYPEGGFAPHRLCFCDVSRKSWSVEQFDIGGEKGNSRRIEAWLVGPDGRLLLDTWLANLDVLCISNDRIKKFASTDRLKWLKPIQKQTSDMVLCDWINVTRD